MSKHLTTTELLIPLTCFFLFGCGEKLSCSSEIILNEVKTKAEEKFSDGKIINKPLPITVSEVVTKNGDKNISQSCSATLKLSLNKNHLEGVSKFYSDDDFTRKMVRYSPSLFKAFVSAAKKKSNPLEMALIDSSDEQSRNVFIGSMLSSLRNDGPEVINLQDGTVISFVEYSYSISEEKSAKGKPIVNISYGQKLLDTLKIYGFVVEAHEPLAISNALKKISSLKAELSELIYSGEQIDDKRKAEIYSGAASVDLVKPELFQSGSYLDYGGPLAQLPNIKVHILFGNNERWNCAIGGYENMKHIEAMGCIYLPNISLARPS